jgi:hypothetical protein
MINFAANGSAIEIMMPIGEELYFVLREGNNIKRANPFCRTFEKIRLIRLPGGNA